MKFTKKQKELIETLLDMIQYGHGWHRSDDNDPTYDCGGCETVAHIVACFMVQKFGADECETAYARDFLKLDTTKEFDRKSMRINLRKLIKTLTK